MFIYKNDAGGDHLLEKGRLLTKRHSQESVYWKGGAYWKEGTKLNHYRTPQTSTFGQTKPCYWQSDSHW